MWTIGFLFQAVHNDVRFLFNAVYGNGGQCVSANMLAEIQNELFMQVYYHFSEGVLYKHATISMAKHCKQLM